MIHEFVSEVLLQPRRALYVNSIRDITDILFSRIAHTGENLTMIDRVCGLISKTFPYPDIQDVEIGAWKERLRNGNTNTLLCPVLSLMPNLKTLEIIRYHGRGYSDMIYKLSKAINSPDRKISASLPLNKLVSVTIEVDGRLNQIHEELGIFEACMTLPSLRRIKGSHIESDFDSWPPEEAFPCVSNVTEVIMGASAISPQALTNLLTRVKGLQRLKYDYNPRTGESEEYSAIRIKAVLEQYAARTLTHLDLGFGAYRVGFIGSLRQLSSLQHLRIQAEMFVEHTDYPHSLRRVDLLPLLPASIETLNLHCPWARSWATFAMNDLGKKRKECLPNLKTVVRERCIPVADGLEEELAGVGIDLYTVENARDVKRRRRSPRMPLQPPLWLDDPVAAYQYMRSQDMQ